MSNLQPIEIAILRTLAYYDIHDYPLTAQEVWRWIFPNSETNLAASKEDVQSSICSLVRHHRIAADGEFFFLPGRQSIVKLRQERKADNQKKWNRAKTIAKYLEVVPFIKMVAIVNTAALNNAKPDSDIDLLIVTAPGHIWIARMMVTAVVSMLGYRRHGQQIKNRICLSFYLTTEALNLEALKREENDVHFMFWASQAVPLLDDGTYERFTQANTWITQHLPHAWTWDWKQHLVPENSGFRGIKKTYGAFFSSPIGAWVEGWARTHQLKRFDSNTESRSRDATTDVVISEEVLKFHEADRRLEYNRKFREQLQRLGLEPAST